jgi:hypothetical protein
VSRGLFFFIPRRDENKYNSKREEEDNPNEDERHLADDVEFAHISPEKEQRSDTIVPFL